MTETTTAVKCTKCGDWFTGYCNRKLCDDCSSEWNTYHRSYRKRHPAYMEACRTYQKKNRDVIKPQYNKWRDEKKFPIVYFVYNDADNSLYIGSTYHKNTRMTKHFGNGKIRTWKEKYNLARVEYIDLSDIVEDEYQLKYIERLFIQSENPIKNTRIPNPKNIDLVRLRELDEFFRGGDFKYCKYDYEVWEKREI